MPIIDNSTDILARWKVRKFILNSGYIEDGSELIVLTDIEYFMNNWDDLKTWAKENNSRVEGMTVWVPDDQTRMLFALRWS